MHLTTNYTFFFQFLSFLSCLLRVNCLIYYLATLCAALWLSVSTCERAYEAHSMHEGLFVYLVVYTEEKDDNLMSEE